MVRIIMGVSASVSFRMANKQTNHKTYNTTMDQSNKCEFVFDYKKSRILYMKQCIRAQVLFPENISD